MPTTYAHYSFGCEVLSRMPEDLQAVVNANRDLFDFGVHGPDLLFYYRPVLPNEVVRTGTECHKRLGREFFAKRAAVMKASPDREAAMSYLLGVLCHFLLDRECHPWVAVCESSGASHLEIEASFDRYLLLKDGYDPLKHKVTGHLHPSARSAKVIAPFYAPITAKQILEAQTSMVKTLDTFVMPAGRKRSAATAILRAVGAKSIADLFMPLEQDPLCTESDPLLLKHWEAAVLLADTAVPELAAFCAGEGQLGPVFDHTFEAY